MLLRWLADNARQVSGVSPGNERQVLVWFSFSVKYERLRYFLRQIRTTEIITKKITAIFFFFLFNENDGNSYERIRAIDLSKNDRFLFFFFAK